MDDLDDYMWDWLPNVIGVYGEKFIEPMTKFLYDASKEEISRSLAGEALMQIGQNYPEGKGECIKILADFLEQADEETSDLNSLIVGNLVDLNAIEKIDIIKRAFDRDVVDEHWVGYFEDVEIEFGLKEKRTKPHSWVQQPIKHVKIGRNDICPCGSGKKFKKCCLGNGIYD